MTASELSTTSLFATYSSSTTLHCVTDGEQVWTHLTGFLVRVSLDPPKLHEVEGTGQVPSLRVVFHCLLVVQDLTRRKVGRDTAGREREREREEERERWRGRGREGERKDTEGGRGKREREGDIILVPRYQSL